MTREDFLELLPELVKDYQPSADVIKHIGEVGLLMIIGPSGVGKTTIIKNLGIQYVPGDTTREPRQGERNGVDYHFRSDYEQTVDDIKSGRFVQVAIGPTGDFYATRADSYPKNGSAVYAVVADVVPIFRKLGFRQTISSFITPPSYDEWTRRISSHELTPEQLAGRITEGQRSLNFALNDKEMHFVLNDELEKAVQQTKDIVNGKVDKERESKARQAAQSILDAIK